MKFTPMMVSIVFGCAAVSLAHAQGVPPLPFDVPPPGGGVVLGGPVGVSSVPAPPANFDPLTASPVARAQYAIPPAPDRTAAPAAHALWQQAVRGPTNRDAPNSIQLTPTNIFNGPPQNVGPSAPYASPAEVPSANIVTTTSSNWSGTADYNAANPFTVEAIIGRFVVPTAHQAFGACTGGWDYSSIWPGIDGFGSSDVLQAGIEADAYCNGSTTSTFYSAWIEWYPYASTRVSSPVIHPGDLVYVEVWNTSPTQGYAYFKNFSTNTAAEYSLTRPPAATHVGNSVEWIVERPSVGGGLATLTNYIDSAWSYGVAWNYTSRTPTYYYQGANPSPPTTLYDITMLDNSGHGISSATIENADFLWFQDFGSACGLASPPC